MIYGIGVAVKMLNTYGFLASINEPQHWCDYFFHYSKLDNKLKNKNWKSLSEELSGKLLFYDRDWQHEGLTWVGLASDVLNGRDDNLKQKCEDIIREQINKGKLTPMGIDLRSFVNGKDYYMKDRLQSDFDNPDAWLKFMTYNDPFNNVFDVFAEKFQEQLIQNDCENELYYKLLYVHNIKWRGRKEETYHYYPESIRPVFDTFSSLRRLGFLSFFESRHHNYAIHKYLDKDMFKHFSSLADGMLTNEVLHKFHNLPEAIKGKTNPHFITWNRVTFDFNYTVQEMVTKRALPEIIEEYENKINKLDKGSTSSYIIHRLQLKDAYMPEIRKSITRLCVDYPSDSEIDAYKKQTQNFSWERDRT